MYPSLSLHDAPHDADTELIARSGGPQEPVAHAAAAPPRDAQRAVASLRVDQRTVVGSEFEEIRVSTIVPAGLQQLCSVIFAPDPAARTGGRIREYQILRETPTERWTYERIKAPPIADRDYVIHVKLDQPAASGRCAVSFENEEDPAHPPVQGAVRIKSMRGKWNVFPTADGSVSVSYELFTDPGGSVPAFLVRGPLKDAAVEFFKKVLARARGVESTSR